ncbi:MAG TPA: ABC transporter substrate-binding protein [Candidatus Limnocylindrales bacterium]|nr:ABC transporter substrate-binding protein [Candidatus Limnocylindrales bacterium]
MSLLFSSPLGAQVATLRVGTNSPASAESVLFSIARDAGVLKQSQLDVEVIFIAGGTLSMQALIGKSLDFLCTGGTPYIVAYLEGAQTKMIGGVNNKLPYGFVSLPNIKTPAQLKGKRIGISRFGSTDDFAVKLALSQFGLNPKTDVSITQVGSAATRLTALQAGSIDAAVLTLGLVQIGQRSGLLLLDFIEKDIEYQQVAIIARDDLLKSRADLVRRFMKGYLDSVRFYKTQKEIAIRETMKRLRTSDRAIAEFDYVQRVRSLPDDGKPSIKGMQLALDDIAKDNPKAKSLTVQQLIDLSFLP